MTVPFVLPTVVVGVAFRTLLATQRPAGRSRARRHAGGDRRRPGLLQPRGRRPHRRRPVGGRSTARREEAAAALGASPRAGAAHGHPAGAAPGSGLGGQRGLPVLRHRVRRGAHPRRGAVRHGRDRDLPAHHPVPRPARAAAALSVLQLVVVVGAARPDRPRRRRPRAAGRPDRRLVGPTPAARAAHLPALAVTAVVVLARWWPRRWSPWWSARCASRALVARALPRPGRHRGRRTSLLPSRSPRRWRTRCGSPSTRRCWRSPLGVLVAVLVTRRVRAPGAAPGLRAFDGVFMLPLGVSAVTVGFGFLVTLDQPAARLPRQPLAGADRPGARRAAAGGPHRWPRRCAASTRASARRPRRWGPTRCGCCASVDLPVAWRPLLAADRLRVRGLAGRVRRDQLPGPAGDGRPCRCVVYQLVVRPGEDSFGPALAASVVLGLVTAAVDGRRRAAPRRVRGEALVLTC